MYTRVARRSCTAVTAAATRHFRATAATHVTPAAWQTSTVCALPRCVAARRRPRVACCIRTFCSADSSQGTPNPGRQEPAVLAHLPDRVGAYSEAVGSENVGIHVPYWAAKPRVAMVVWTHRRGADLGTVQGIVSFLQENDIVVLAPHDSVTKLGANASYRFGDELQLTRTVDFIITVGGRSYARSRLSALFPNHMPPVMAFRRRELGRDGRADMRAIRMKLHDVIHGSFTVKHRLRFDCLVGNEDDEEVDELEEIIDLHYDRRTADTEAPAPIIKNPRLYRVIHEVVMHRAPTAIPVQLDLFVNGIYFTTVVADGAIVSTPSGSPHYNRAAGGSLLHPFVQCYQITPLNPCSLSFRSVILSGQDELTLRTKSQGSQSLILDSTTLSTTNINTIAIRKSRYPFASVRLWHSPPTSPSDIDSMA